jgi:uncharacterized protein (DUF1810 family)
MTLMSAYLDKQEAIAKQLPEKFHGPIFQSVVADLRAGKQIGSHMGCARLHKAPFLVQGLGMSLEDARAVAAADMAEYQAAVAEYQAA